MEQILHLFFILLMITAFFLISKQLVQELGKRKAYAKTEEPNLKEKSSLSEKSPSKVPEPSEISEFPEDIQRNDTKGSDVSENEPLNDSNKEETVNNSFWITLGYVFAFIMPPVGAGFSAYFILGEHDRKTKDHGWYILLISGVIFALVLQIQTL